MKMGDLDEVMAIERLSFSHPWLETTFQGEIQNDGISFPLVAVHQVQKRIVGYVLYWKIRDDVQINNIAVHPDFRRFGMGEAMLRDVLLRTKCEGAVFVSLEVRVSNTAARALYEKFGFKPLAVRKNYYTYPDEDALVLSLDLKE